MPENNSKDATPVHPITTEAKPFTEGLPHQIGLHLPLPGDASVWPASIVGQWQREPDKQAASWLERHRQWRREHLVRIGYSDEDYVREELAWGQRNYVQTLVMVEDRYFFDSQTRRYTVDRYLDDLETRFGGIDSVLIWYVYPNIGIDDRGQIQLAHDLPGGAEGLKSAVDDFHRRGVRVFLPIMPWDVGTADHGSDPIDAIVALAVAIGADGINGDTYASLPRSFREKAEAIGGALALQPEVSVGVEESLRWNTQSWGKASTEFIPAVSKLKWLEPRHMINLENRWARDRIDDLQYCFFNGIGYVAWENIWGIWNGITQRDANTLRRIAAIYRAFSSAFVSKDWAPYATTLQPGTFASMFPDSDGALWTLINRNGFPLDGEQIEVFHRHGARYWDLWNGEELRPLIQTDTAILSVSLASRGFGCICATHEEAPAHLTDHLARVANMPSIALSSASWSPLSQTLTPLELTVLRARAPEGMIGIPSAEYLFKVSGIEIEGNLQAGIDVQYPWESCPIRHHRRRMSIDGFFIDRHLVTNREFSLFVEATHYSPPDDHNFLKHWIDQKPVPGREDQPVVWVSVEDARAYAAWAQKRLPHEWEWQYAAQGMDQRIYPWGNEWDEGRVPARGSGRSVNQQVAVGTYPKASSPFGLQELIGHVWQWTDEYADEHTRFAIIRGGSSWKPEGSHWYFPQSRRLDQHGKYLLTAPCKDRSALIGFRCVADR